MMNVNASKQIFKIHEAKLTGLQGKIHKSTIIVRNLKIPLSAIGKTSKQNISKDTVNLNTTNQLN